MISNLDLLLPDPDGPSFLNSPAGPRGLEIGGGPYARRLGFRQFDAIDWHDRTGLNYELGDARSLPYETGFFDHVYSSNLLEHFPSEETASVLGEWTRVLRVDGLLELIVPDAMGILLDYFTNRNPSWPECEERLLGSKDYDGNRHYTAFTRSTFMVHVELCVPELATIWCKGSHSGGGIWLLATKTR